LQVGSQVGWGGVENSLQIAVLSDLTEHLRHTAGLHVAAVVWSTESPSERDHSFEIALPAPANLGDRSWGRAEQFGCIGSRAKRVVVITGGLVLAPISIWCLVGAIALLTATAWITVLQRILFVRKQLVARE